MEQSKSAMSMGWETPTNTKVGHCLAYFDLPIPECCCVDCFQDLLAMQEKLSRADVRCQSLEASNAVLKSAEARLVQDRENILREKCSQNLLLANLQAIQVMLNLPLLSSMKTRLKYEGLMQHLFCK